jgi:hypothetical protein
MNGFFCTVCMGNTFKLLTRSHKTFFVSLGLSSKKQKERKKERENKQTTSSSSSKEKNGSICHHKQVQVYLTGTSEHPSSEDSASKSINQSINLVTYPSFIYYPYTTLNLMYINCCLWFLQFVSRRMLC